MPMKHVKYESKQKVLLNFKQEDTKDDTPLNTLNLEREINIKNTPRLAEVADTIKQEDAPKDGILAAGTTSTNAVRANYSLRAIS
ncbi:hypothetical protein MBANPS3_011005 [Mucor bainieri]